MLVGKALFVLMVIYVLAAFGELVASEINVGRASVIDGDTIEIRGTRYRLFGVDAFESSQLCGEPGQLWPCGRRSAAALDMFLGNAPVTCRPKGKSYDRIVAKCFKATGEDLGQFMVLQGWALAAPRYSLDYVGDQESAQAAQRGAWRSKFIPPWDYRHHKDGRAAAGE